MIEDNCIAQMFLDQDITGGSREEFESQVLPAHSVYYEYSKYFLFKYFFTVFL
jgi:hypothetical protein